MRLSTLWGAGKARLPVNLLKSITFSVPGVEPLGVTLQEIKDHLAISHNDLNSYLTNILLPAARRMVENENNVSLVPQTITAVISNLKGNFPLPFGPVTSVTSMHDYDGDEILSTEYELGSENEGYPWIVSPVTDYVKVVYEAGFAVVPPEFKILILQKIAWLKEHRGDEEQTGYPARIL